MLQLLDKQKKAVRNVNPPYVLWKEKDKELSSCKTQIKTEESNLKTGEKALKQAEEMLGRAKEQEPEIDRLKTVINKIDEEKPKYQQKEELEGKRKELEERDKNASVEEAALQEEENALHKKLKALQQTIQELKDKPGELKDAKAEGKQLTKLLEKLNKIIDTQIPEREKRKKELSKKQKAFLTARDQYDEVHSRREEAEHILENSRAGILAGKLVEGEKCPVCGSVHHPEPAKLETSSISEEDFKKLQEEEAKLQEKKNDANTKAETAKTSLEEFEKQLRGNISDCFQSEFLNVDLDMEGKPLEELIAETKEVKKQVEAKSEENIGKLRSLDEDCKRLQKAEEELKTAQEDETEKLNLKKEELRENRQKIKDELTETKATLEMLKDLSFPDWKTAKNEREQAQIEKNEKSDAIKKAEGNKKEADEKVTAVRSQIKMLNKQLKQQEKDEADLREKLDHAVSENGFSSVDEMKEYAVNEDEIALSEQTIQKYQQDVETNRRQLEVAWEDAKGKQRIDIEELKTVYDKQKEDADRIRENCSNCANRMRINEEKQKRILDGIEELEKARKENAICQRLYNLVKGTTGNGKITLEQYIQAAGFDGIIAAANRRLLPMSDGQYELYRQKDALGKQRNHFLDLEVLDNYTGHRRPVGNLSGGESFKASLSLALGLSDTVSSNLGGVQMDALFVDEGFGTLDRKSIDNAMEILINLTGSNKLVGIISHREELIENIPQQIKVKKTKHGSQIAVECGI